MLKLGQRVRVNNGLPCSHLEAVPEGALGTVVHVCNDVNCCCPSPAVDVYFEQPFVSDNDDQDHVYHFTPAYCIDGETFEQMLDRELTVVDAETTAPKPWTIEDAADRLLRDLAAAAAAAGKPMTCIDLYWWIDNAFDGFIEFPLHDAVRALRYAEDQIRRDTKVALDGEPWLPSGAFYHFTFVGAKDACDVADYELDVTDYINPLIVKEFHDSFPNLDAPCTVCGRKDGTDVATVTVTVTSRLWGSSNATAPITICQDCAKTLPQQHLGNPPVRMVDSNTLSNAVNQ